MQRNFRQFEQSATIEPTDHSMDAMVRLAQTLV
jgi:hypothetical protein